MHRSVPPAARAAELRLKVRKRRRCLGSCGLNMQLSVENSVSAESKKTKAAAFIAGCCLLSAFAMMLGALASFSQSVNQLLQLVGLGPPTRLGSAQTAPPSGCSASLFCRGPSAVMKNETDTTPTRWGSFQPLAQPLL